MLRARSVGSDEGQIDVGASGCRKIDLGLFRSVFKALQSHLVFLQINARIFLAEFFVDPVDDHFIKVITTEHGVSIGSLDFEDTITNFEHRNIKGSTTQVIDRNLFCLLGVEAIGKRCGSGFVHDAKHFKACDLARIFGGLTLRIVEVCGHGDHSLCDCLAEVIFCDLLHGRKDLRRDLGWCKFFVVDLYAHEFITSPHEMVREALFCSRALFVATSHEALDRVNGLFWIGDRLALSHLTYKSFAVFAKRNDRWRGAETFTVRDDNGLSAFHHSDA